MAPTYRRVMLPPTKRPPDFEVVAGGAQHAKCLIALTSALERGRTGKRSTGNRPSISAVVDGVFEFMHQLPGLDSNQE